MLRARSGLSRPLLRWASQVTASIGATLVATLVWSVVPHPGAPPASPELTSGGKFAARAVAPSAVHDPVAPPLPWLASAAVSAGNAAPAPRRASLDRASWAPVVDRPVRPGQVPRLPARIAPRRAAPVPAEVPTAAEPVSDAEDDVLQRIVPTWLPRVPTVIAAAARGAWTATVSAGDALSSRVVPRSP